MILSFFRGSSPLVILGMGNPGKEYEGTRHNAGRGAVALWAKRQDLFFSEKKEFFAHIAEANAGGKKIIAALSSVFMNQSGKTAAALANFYRIKPENIIALHDDMDLPLGSIKIVFGRGSGGHKGVESVFRALRTRDITRIRIGSMGSRGQKPGNRELSDIVLKRLTPAEKTSFAKGVRKAADALEAFIAEGREKAMGQYN